MRVLNALVFDDVVQNTADGYTSAEWNRALGGPDKIWILALVTQVTAGAPTVTVQVETGNNERDWVNLSGTAEINRLPVFPGAKWVLTSAQISNTQSAVRLRVNVDAGSARIAVWVTGRAPARSAWKGVRNEDVSSVCV